MANFSRRELLRHFGRAAVMAGTSAAVIGKRPALAKARSDSGISLALGSGGASGLSHIIVLEALEELGIRPSCISGSSIGALVGALYAAGHDSKTMKEIVTELVPGGLAGWLSAAFSKDRISLIELLKVDINSGSLFDQDSYGEFLEKKMGRKKFEDLSIPLLVTATDFWERIPIVFDSGPVIPSVIASTALPGVFPPLQYEDRFLVDGGIANPVPYDLIMNKGGITIAVEVLGKRKRPENGMPGYLDLVFNTFDIMQSNVIRFMRQRCEPDIYLIPPLTGIRTLDFHRAQEIYDQAAPVKESLKRKLDKVYGHGKQPGEDIRPAIYTGVLRNKR